MSGFSALNTGLTGLAAAQRAMDVAGQNVVNANTPGYSRQRVVMNSVGAPVAASFHTGGGSLYGVSVDAVNRTRDAFLEGTRAAAGGRMAALETQSAVLTGIERLLAEPGDTGLQAVLDDFFTSWHDLAQRPGDSATGAVVIERGVTVATQLKYVAEGAAASWQTAQNDLEAVVQEANQAAADLAEINNKIREGAGAGRPVNELLDRRDQLVRNLSELVGGVAVPGPDGMVGVSVGGVTLVAGSRAEQFTVSGAGEIGAALTDPPTVRWGTTAVPVESGAAAGLLGVVRSDLPNFLAELDGVTAALTTAVNAVHSGGFTLAGAPGGAFFTGTDSRTLSVAITNPADLAVADAAGSVDGANALQLGDLMDERSATAVLGGPGPTELWRVLSTTMGSRVQGLDRAKDVQASVLATADAAVEADAGVNMDEEMTNMLLFQRAYEASARVITTVDQMLDTLVNRTGVVGR